MTELSSSKAIWEYYISRNHSASDSIAASVSGIDLTYARLQESASTIYRALQRAGVKYGDLVALAASRSISFLPAFLALCRLGARIALVSTKYRRPALAAIMRGLRPRAFLTTSKSSTQLAAKMTFLMAVEIPFDKSCEPLCLLWPRANGSSLYLSDIAVIKFGGGLAGRPIAVALAAENVLAAANNAIVNLAVTPDDTIYSQAPIDRPHVFDLGAMAAIFSGARLVLPGSSAPPRTAGDIADLGVTIVLGTPRMYRLLLETRISSRPDLSRIRYLLSCAAAPNTELIALFHTRFGRPICQYYGSPETGPVAVHVPDRVLGRPASVGRPVKGLDLKIVGPDGEALAPGYEGEIVISGPAVARGYLTGDLISRRTFDGNSFYTDYLGVVDAGGFLYLKGRVDSAVNMIGPAAARASTAHPQGAGVAIKEPAKVAVGKGPGRSGRGQVKDFGMGSGNLPRKPGGGWHGPSAPPAAEETQVGSRWWSSFSSLFRKALRHIYRREIFHIMKFDMENRAIPSLKPGIDVVMRPLTPEDGPAFLELWQSRAAMKQRRFAQRMGDGYIGTGTWYGKRLVGVNWITLDKDFDSLTGLWIHLAPGSCLALDLQEHEDFGGLRIGLATLAHSLREAKERGVRLQFICVNNENKKMLAGAKYLLGYKKVGEITTTYWFDRPHSRWRLGDFKGRGRMLALGG